MVPSPFLPRSLVGEKSSPYRAGKWLRGTSHNARPVREVPGLGSQVLCQHPEATLRVTRGNAASTKEGKLRRFWEGNMGCEISAVRVRQRRAVRQEAGAHGIAGSGYWVRGGKGHRTLGQGCGLDRSEAAWSCGSWPHGEGQDSGAQSPGTNAPKA